MHASTPEVLGCPFRRSKRRLLTLLLTAACCLAFAGGASATSIIVDISALTNATTTDGDNDDPSAVAVNLFLTAGTYDVVPIGPAQGGAFTAWNAWGGQTSGCDTSGANCNRGWMHWYRLQSSEFSRVRVQDGILYSTPAAALANSLTAQFTLAADGVVHFFIFDSGPSDNIGGVSLEVTPVPEPSTVVLSTTALIIMGVAYLRRRRKGSTA